MCRKRRNEKKIEKEKWEGRQGKGEEEIREGKKKEDSLQTPSPCTLMENLFSSSYSHSSTMILFVVGSANGDGSAL